MIHRIPQDRSMGERLPRHAITTVQHTGALAIQIVFREHLGTRSYSKTYTKFEIMSSQGRDM